MKTVLVSGGAGYLGAILCEKLLRSNYEVICLDRFFFGEDKVAHLVENPNFHLVKEDTRFATEEVFRNVWAVVDLAGISNDPACEIDAYVTNSINYDGAMHIARMAKQAGVSRYIYSSSCSVYGHGKSAALTEESSLEPVSLYAKLKVRVEEELFKLQSSDFCVSCLRNATIYGLSPRMRFDLVINLMTLVAWKNRKIQVLGGGQQWRPVVHLKDVSHAIELVLQASSETVGGQVFNVGSKEQNYQVFVIANIIRDIIPNVDVEIIPDDPDRRTYNVSFDKIQNVLGFSTSHTIPQTVLEIKKQLESGSLDPNEIRFYTLKFYKYLRDAEQTLQKVSYRGRIF